MALKDQLVVLTYSKAPGVYWVAHDTVRVFEISGLEDAIKHSGKYHVKIISSSNKAWEAFNCYIFIIDWMMHKDPNGEYDQLPLCLGTINHLQMVLQEWDICQEFPFTNYNPNYANAMRSLTEIGRRLINGEL